MRIIVMGPSGCGKTTIARALAETLGLPWADGDDFHTQEAVEKMSRGAPLTDADRAPWFQHIADALNTDMQIIACSALKRSYRDWLSSQVDGLIFIYPAVSAHELRHRLGERSGHFVDETLLDSQLDTLDPPAPDEPVLTVDGNKTPDEILREVTSHPYLS